MIKQLITGLIILYNLRNILVNKPNFPFEILAENKYFLAINKPSGLVVHEGIKVTSKTLVMYLEDYFKTNNIPIYNQRCGLVHRLDRDTSGVCLVAKTADAYSKFKVLFKNRSIKKVYVALAYASNNYHTGSIIHFESELQHRKGTAYYEARAGLMSKSAIGVFKICARRENTFWIEINMKTGRTHQIRIQLLDLGMPIINDKIYLIKKSINRDSDYHFLHAYSIEFPKFWANQQELNKIIAPIPQRFKIRFNTK